MKNSTINLIFPNNESLNYKELVVDLLNDSDLVKNIVRCKDLTNYFVQFDDSSKISLEDVLRLSIDVNHSGSFCFFIKNEKKNTLKLIEEVSELNHKEVVTKEDAIKRLKDIMNLFSGELLFIIYSPRGELSLNKDECLIDTFVLVLDKDEEQEKIKEESPKENTKHKLSFMDFLSPFRTNGSHYAFVLVSTLLIGFSSSLGIYFQNKGETLFFFFYACTAIGSLIDIFVYIDFFKRNKILSADFIDTVITILISMGLAIGGFYIFYDFQKENVESSIKIANILLISILIMVLVNAVFCLIGWFIGKNSKSKEIDEEE